MERRDHALDALRGLAVIGLIWSAFLPWGTLPPWMYPAQLPPPTMVPNPNVFGISWVDLLFPIFVYCLGAAIPHALATRIPSQELSPRIQIEAWVRLWVSVIWRTATLIALAKVLAYLRYAPGDTSDAWMAIGWFVALALAFIRFPAYVPVPLTYALRLAGIAVVAIGVLNFPESTRSEPRFAALGLIYFAGVAIYLATRHSAIARLFASVIVGTILVAATFPGEARTWLEWKPVPGWIEASYLRYLVIALPATLVGEAFLKWDERRVDVERAATATAALLGLAATFVALYQQRPTMILVAVCAIPLLGLKFSEQSRQDRRVQAVAWGLLTIGFLLMPIGGGPRKEPETISYLFLGGGLAGLAYAVLSFVNDAFRKPSQVQVSPDAYATFGATVRGLTQFNSSRPGFFALVGENALLGCFALTNLVHPVLQLSQGAESIRNLKLEPWPAAGVGLGIALIVAAILALLSKLRIWSRA